MGRVGVSGGFGFSGKEGGREEDSDDERADGWTKGSRR